MSGGYGAVSSPRPEDHEPCDGVGHQQDEQGLDEEPALGVGEVLGGDASGAHLAELAGVRAQGSHGGITRGKYSTRVEGD